MNKTIGFLILMMSLFSHAEKFKSEIVLYQSESSLKELIPQGATELAEYIKEICLEYEKSYLGNDPELFDIVVVIKPERRSKIWFASNLPNREKNDILQKKLEEIKPPLIIKRPLVFAISYALNGIDLRLTKVDGKFNPPIPMEWKEKAKSIKGAVTIPDVFIPYIWPD